MAEERRLADLKQVLKAKYTDENANKIERLFYPENPLPLAGCYLDLALVEEKIIKAKKAEGTTDAPAASSSASAPEDLSRREHFLREYERIEHIQKKLEVRAILDECKKPKKRIYIEGAAGAGKSTLSRYLANEWAMEQAPWNQYEWVFYIRLRELSIENYPATLKELLQVVNGELFIGDGNHLESEIEYSFFKSEIRKYPQKVLWILDGYDELNPAIAHCNWWKDLLASNYDLLITSRPGAQLSKIEFGINLNLAVLGFNDEQVKTYIQNFFDPKHTPDVQVKDATDCLTLIKNNPNLWSLSHTPIQLELMCSIWEDLKEQKEIPLTELYRVMLERLMKRRADREDISLKRAKPPLLKKRYANYLLYMEYLAFLGMQARQIVLSEKQINQAYKTLPGEAVGQFDFQEQLEALGLIKIYKNGKQAEFAHLTFQEFFAARYVAKAIKAFSQDDTYGLSHQDLLDFIGEAKWNNFYEVMWWFVAGLLGDRPQQQKQDLERYKFHGGDSDNIEILEIPKSHQRLQILQTFFDLLLQEPREPLEAFELPLLVSCLAEAGMPNIMQQIAIKLHFERWLRFYWIEGGDVLKTNALQKLVYVLKINGEIVGWIEFMLLALLKNKDKNVRGAAALAVNILGTSVSEKLQKGLVSLLHDEEWLLRRAAVRVVGALEVSAIDELQKEVLSLLKDENVFVRLAVVDAVSALGALASEELQKGLLVLLKDENEDVRRAAADAVGAIGTAASEDLQKSLLPLLQDEEPYVCYAAATARVAALDRSSSEKFQKDLLVLLKDKNKDVRCAAAKAVGELGASANETLQQGLLPLLQDEDVHVCYAAVKAVGVLGASASEELQKSLLPLLEEKDRWSVIAEAVQINFVEEGFIPVLQSIDMSYLAAKALGRTKSGLVLLCQKIFKDRPRSIPPSRIITVAQDITKVDQYGKLDCLKLCGTVLQNIVQENGSHNLTESSWTLAIVRKKTNEAATSTSRSNPSSALFQSIKGLVSHAFLILEGVKDGVRFATKIDLYAIGDGGSQSSGQKIKIAITEIDDFTRLETLANSSSCMVHAITRKKAAQLIAVIRQDQLKAEQGEMVYSLTGDGSASSSNQKPKHSCISWCLEKWQQAGLPLQRKWYDAIVVVPKAYLKEEKQTKEKDNCLIM